MVIIDKNLAFTINPSRMHYLLDLYDLSKDKFLEILQGSNKNPVLSDSEFTKILEGNLKVKVSILKKIDAIFGKGLTWYISKRDLPKKEKLSVFFRKDTFNSELSLGSRKKVAEFEQKKTEIEQLCASINYNANRSLSYTLKDNPESVAIEVRKKFDEIRIKLKKDELLNPKNTDRDYLENLIRMIEECNVFVFEFIETWNQKNKVNFNGFFISPNIIVIKRQQNYLKREIYTLLHEFAHYLLNIEEIDELVGTSEPQNDVERWCNDFAYFYLISDFKSQIETLSEANDTNNYHKELLEEISQKTRLSTLSLYTRLKLIRKISDTHYQRIYSEIKDSVETRIKEEKERRQLEQEILKEKGGKPFGMSPKPIESKLYKDLLKLNYFEGRISESQVISGLNEKKKSFSEVIYS